MRDLNELEQESIYIIREALAQFKNPAVLWSTGKDSTASAGTGAVTAKGPTSAWVSPLMTMVSGSAIP